MDSWESFEKDLLESKASKLYPGSNLVIGRGNKKPRIVFIGEAPGAEEDKQRLPFVGRSGQLLDKMIEHLGLTDEYYITNVVKVRPPENRDPTKEEIETSKPWLARQLKLLQPEIIICVGRFAMNYFFPKKKSILQESGRIIENKYYIIPHPSYFLRKGGTGWEPYLEKLRNHFGIEAKHKQKTLF